jgi:hypothetical protein
VVFFIGSSDSHQMIRKLNHVHLVQAVSQLIELVRIDNMTTFFELLN